MMKLNRICLIACIMTICFNTSCKTIEQNQTVTTEYNIETTTSIEELSVEETNFIVEESSIADTSSLEEQPTSSIEKIEETTTKETTLETKSVILVGDSRAVGMCEAVDQGEHETFIAKSGSRYAWMIEEAIPQLQTILDTNDTTYDVVIMMGVNDCFDSKQTPSTFNASTYAKTINELIEHYPNVNFYVCSVNPCDGARAYVNAEIWRFNGILKLQCDATYIDTAKNCTFTTIDGLHYDDDTYQRLYQYIITFLS